MSFFTIDTRQIVQIKQWILNHVIICTNNDSVECLWIFNHNHYLFYLIQKNDPNLPASVHRLTAIEYRHVIPPRGCEQHGHACADARSSCTRLKLRHYNNLDNKSRGTCIPTSNGIFQKVPRESKAGRACFIEFRRFTRLKGVKTRGSTSKWFSNASEKSLKS